jgi:catechol 2,3-dioxygenase
MSLHAIRVSRIGHIALRVPDLARSVAFAETILGLRVSEYLDGAAYLTCNERHHELVLMEGSEVACDHLGFEVFDAEVFATLVRRIERDHEVVGRGALECGIGDAIRFVAPGGFVFEVFFGMARHEPTSYDSVAPTPLKFEHITVKSSQKERLEDVLIQVLGLRLSDRAEDAISWLRASDEHHGLSIIRSDVDQLQHYAWTVDSFATIARIGDRLMNHGRTFLWGPGHHGIGDNYFCYFEDGDGVLVEYSAGIQRIENDAAYVPRVWPDEPLSVNKWGNPPPPPEFVAAGTPIGLPAVAR